ncbi:MAG: LuxR C-terminal-related transcriptional regulator [Actinomycetales bacterium]
MLRNHVELVGVRHMLHSLGVACESREDGDMVAAVAAACDLGAVLVVALRDIGAEAVPILRAATDDGLKILLLLADDLGDLPRLAGVRYSGIAYTTRLTAQTLETTLRRIAAGDLAIPHDVAHHLADMASQRVAEAGTRSRVRMTPREREVLTLLIEGMSNKQISRRLDISSHGVKRLVANILAKLDAPNRTQAVATVLREGLHD